MDLPCGIALISHLKQQPSAAIVNVTSALVFAPKSEFPFYAVAKTGLRAFTQSLRFQLEDAQIEVFEVVPPMVDIALNKSAGAKITPQQVAVETLEGMERDSLSETLRERFEIQVERSKILALVSRIAPNFALSFINKKD